VERCDGNHHHLRRCRPVSTSDREGDGASPFGRVQWSGRSVWRRGEGSGDGLGSYIRGDARVYHAPCLGACTMR
jgi:hypothetical protein